jgi:hypothetical protein
LSENSAPDKNKLDQVKNELRSFTSLHGFSTVLNTSNPLIKVLWVFFFLVLFSGCIQNGLENLNDYYQYTVITKIEYVNENPMKLPAVTLCLASYPSYTSNATLSDALFECKIGETKCDHKDFYSFQTRTSFSNNITTCYVLNGGRNSTGHSSEIKSAKNTGSDSGFVIRFYLPTGHFLFYHINDPYVAPNSNEIEKIFLPGMIDSLKIEKSVEAKLEFPFNNCWDRTNLPVTPLVRKLSGDNITYRQVNCFELCFQNFVQKYALDNKMSGDAAREKDEVKNYDKAKNCNNLCPLECESTQYRISESKSSLNHFSSAEEYGLKHIPEIQKILNITINSTEDFNKNYLKLQIAFDSLKYTKISQTPKTTLSTLVSNLGGSIGLFLDLSFMSACRAVDFILRIVF